MPSVQPVLMFYIHKLSTGIVSLLGVLSHASAGLAAICICGHSLMTSMHRSYFVCVCCDEVLDHMDIQNISYTNCTYTMNAYDATDGPCNY